MSAPSSPFPFDDHDVDLKNPWLAAGLALVLPGLGHLYQGRNFKAGVYCVCILGLFFTGQALGEWKVVYLANSESSGRLSVGRRVEIVGRLLQGYGAQFPVGVVAWPAIWQSQRYSDPLNSDDEVRIDAPISAPFEGGIWINSAHQGPVMLAPLAGTIRLEKKGRAVVGRFEGTSIDGREVSLKVRVVELGRQVGASELRPIVAGLPNIPNWPDWLESSELRIPPEAQPYISGGIERPFWNWYQVPLGKAGVDRLITKLGANAEIAWVFTWIAGLLNILAIWDAFDGPAYGIGTERELNRSRRGKDKTNGETDADSAPAPAPAGQAV